MNIGASEHRFCPHNEIRRIRLRHLSKDHPTRAVGEDFWACDWCGQEFIPFSPFSGSPQSTEVLEPLGQAAL